MKLAVVFMLLVVLLGIVQSAPTSQEMIKAINVLRANAKSYIPFHDMQRGGADKKGKECTRTVKQADGTSVQETYFDPCYDRTREYLNNMPSLAPLKENIVADLAAWKHSKCLIEGRCNGHQSEDGSGPASRLSVLLPTPRGMMLNEAIGGYMTYNGVPPTTDQILFGWIGEGCCGTPGTEGHRDRLFRTNTQKNQDGCGSYDKKWINDKGNTVILTSTTCMGVTPLITLGEHAIPQLAEAGLSMAANNVGYTGVELQLASTESRSLTANDK